MQNFSIKDIENLTGIKAHTLRIWELRYNVFQPKRKESQHRIYDNEDLKRLLRIAFLYHNGWKISKIDALAENEIKDYVRNAKFANASYSTYANKLIEAAIDFNEQEFKNIISEVIDHVGFEKCIIELCYPFLQKIGLLWSTNNVVPAQEHFSSYIIQNRIILETDKLELRTVKPGIALFCPHEEYHELPLLFINYLLRKNGQSTIYLGASIKLDEISKAAFLPDIHCIYIHLITNLTGFELEDYFAELCKTFPDKRIVASGEGVRKIKRSFTNLQLLKTDKEIYDFVSGA